MKHPSFSIVHETGKRTRTLISYPGPLSVEAWTQLVELLDGYSPHEVYRAIAYWQVQHDLDSRP